MICSTSTAMLELFNHAKDSLPIDKLERLGNLSDHAEHEAENMAATLEALANLVSTTVAPDDDRLSRILWSLSTQASSLSALIKIAADAEHLARQRSEEAPDRGKP